MGGGQGGVHGQQASPAACAMRPQPPLPPGPPPPGDRGEPSYLGQPAGQQPACGGAASAAAAAAAMPACTSRVRQPPSPSRSPPLPVEQLYEVAGWNSRLLSSTQAAQASAQPPRLPKAGGGAGQGHARLFGACSSSSSDGEESGGDAMPRNNGAAERGERAALPGTAEAAAAAASASTSGSSCPFSLLSLFTAAPTSEEDELVPRSHEIYRLSNLNKVNSANPDPNPHPHPHPHPHPNPSPSPNPNQVRGAQGRPRHEGDALTHLDGHGCGPGAGQSSK